MKTGWRLCVMEAQPERHAAVRAASGTGKSPLGDGQGKVSENARILGVTCARSSSVCLERDLRVYPEIKKDGLPSHYCHHFLEAEDIEPPYQVVSQA